MTRHKLTLEYDGAPYVGWQRQSNGPSVQAHLEMAVTRLSGETVTVFGAGRTDAGVHAAGQVAHFDLQRAFDPDTVRDALNFHLKPEPIAVLRAEVVPDDFHARFSAVRRTYRYRIVSRRAPLALERGRAWWTPVRLDMAAMAAAASVLCGRHDFTTFRAAECQARSPVKTLDRLDISQVGDRIEFTVTARSFLHHQVRNMVGSLRKVGEGKWTAADLRRALMAKDRREGGMTAPAGGLTLMRVDYASTGDHHVRDPVDEQVDDKIEADESCGGDARNFQRGPDDEPEIDHDRRHDGEIEHNGQAAAARGNQDGNRQQKGDLHDR